MLLAGQGTAVAAEKGAAREVKKQSWQQGQVLLAGRGTVAAVVTGAARRSMNSIGSSDSAPM